MLPTLKRSHEKIEKEMDIKRHELYVLRDQCRLVNLKRYPYMDSHERMADPYLRVNIYKSTRVCPHTFSRVEPIWNLDKELFPVIARKDHYDVAVILKMELNYEIDKRMCTMVSKKNTHYMRLRHVLPQIATDTLLIYPKRMIPTDLIHMIVSYLS